MSGSDGYIGWASRISRMPYGTAVYVKMPGAREISPSKPKRDRVDMTHCESPGMFPESRPGFFSDTEVTFKMTAIDSIADPVNAAIQEALFTLRGTGQVETWKIEWYSNATVPVLLRTETFTAWLDSCDPGTISPKEAQTIDVTLAVTGLPVRT